MSESTKNYLRVEERYYSAHHTLLLIAEQSLKRAQEKQPGWFNDAFICITFSALAIEAMANAIGDRAIPDWSEFESASPTAKLRLLAEHLGLTYGKAEPWSTIKWLAKFRNQVAHPKPELVTTEKIISESQRHERSGEPPDSKFERQITIENARRSFEAVYKAKRLLCAQLSPEISLGLETDGWHGSTTPLNPSN